ncbi:MAG: hypothetical protein K8R88_01260 [Armatimonadetes bacterium]|nr:hypothetical protein [Armatimonadota bacterium]
MLSIGVFAVIVLGGQKETDVWRWRVNLNGQQVEIYDRMKGDKKLGTGLRRIVQMKDVYNIKYENFIKPEWESLFVVRGKVVFVRKTGEWFKPLYTIPTHLDKGKLKQEKPVITPYLSLEVGALSYETGGLNINHFNTLETADFVMGIRSRMNPDHGYSEELRKRLQLPYQGTQVFDMDILDPDLNVKFTLNNVRNVPRRYGKVWKIEYDTNSVAPLTALLNDEGEPVAPDMPLVKQFITDYDESKVILAIPTSLKFDRFIPIMPDGQFKPEPLPTAGYYPSLAIYEDSVPFFWNVQHWIKEYTTPDGPRFGYANLDLSQESGPLWRSITWWKHPYYPGGGGSEIVAQFLDGTWTVYSSVPGKGGDSPHRPYINKAFPTREAAIAAFVPVYQKEVAEPALAKQREDFKIQTKKWNEYLEYLGVDKTMDPGGVAVGDLSSLLYATVTSLNSRLYSDFDQAWPKLPGDYRLKYMAIAYQLRRISLSEENARSYAGMAVNPGIKATFTSIANSIKNQIAEDARRVAEAKKQAAMGYGDAGKFNARAPASGPGFVSPFRDVYAQPSYADQSRRHEQYMSEMYKYLGGQQSWRPYK